MSYLLAQLWPWVLLSGVIGLATGWWIWRARADTDGVIAAPYIPPAPPEEELIEETPVETSPADAAPDTVQAAAPSEEPPEAEPEAEAPPEPAAASPFLDAPDGEPDDLTRIKGVGPKLNDMLHAIGVYHFAQIAGWNADEITEVDARLEAFQGRIERDRWAEQAGYLADDDMVSFRREFGKPRGEH